MLTSITDKVAELNRLVVNIYQDHCSSRIFILMFHVLNKQTEDLGTFKNSKMLDASPFERFNVHVKQIYRHTQQRLSSSTDEVVKVMEQGMNDTLTASNGQVNTSVEQTSSVRDKLQKRRTPPCGEKVKNNSKHIEKPVQRRIFDGAIGRCFREFISIF